MPEVARDELQPGVVNAGMPAVLGVIRFLEADTEAVPEGFPQIDAGRGGHRALLPDRVALPPSPDAKNPSAVPLVKMLNSRSRTEPHPAGLRRTMAVISCTCWRKKAAHVWPWGVATLGRQIEPLDSLRLFHIDGSALRHLNHSPQSRHWRLT